MVASHQSLTATTIRPRSVSNMRPGCISRSEMPTIWRSGPFYTGVMGNYAAYLNGDWVSSTDLRIPVDDVGFAMGATVTERLRTFRGRVFRLDEHLSRLGGSLRIVGLDADAIVAEIGQAI